MNIIANVRECVIALETNVFYRHLWVLRMFHELTWVFNALDA